MNACLILKKHPVVKNIQKLLIVSSDKYLFFLTRKSNSALKYKP